MQWGMTTNSPLVSNYSDAWEWPLLSEYNGDPSCRVVIPGYIPSFTKKKATPGKTKKASSVSVRDYHECMSILLEPLVNARQNPHLVDVLLGDQIRRVYLIIIMGIVLGDGKSTDMLCGRVLVSHSKTLRLSHASFTPLNTAADTINIFCGKSRMSSRLLHVLPCMT